MRRTITALCLLAAATVLSACGATATTRRDPGTITAERRDVPPSSFSVTIMPPRDGGER